MALDIIQTVLNLLSDNWNSSNTDSRTPNFIKVTDIKRLDFRTNQDYIIAQRPTDVIEPAGVGDANKHESENIDIDIRVLGPTQEAHFYNVVEEVKRIVQQEKINPVTTVPENHVFEFDGSAIDLSNKTYNLFRIMLPTRFKRFNINR